MTYGLAGFLSYFNIYSFILVSVVHCDSSSSSTLTYQAFWPVPIQN
jgi:hypothetical protein